MGMALRCRALWVIYTATVMFSILLGLSLRKGLPLRLNEHGIDIGSLIRALYQGGSMGGDGSNRLGKACTNEHLRRYYQINDSLPGQGYWDEWDHFHPSLCELTNETMSDVHLYQCFIRKKITTVVTVGNSNVARFFLALVKQFSQGSSVCYMDREEKFVDHRARGGGHLRSVSYYARGNKMLESALKAGRMKCKTCFSRTYVCNSSLGEIRLEHLAMMLMWDQSLTIAQGPHGLSARSVQEFLFKYYIPKLGPDLIFLVPPANLMKQARNFTEQITAIDAVNKLIGKYLPETMVYWISSFSEVDEQKPALYRNKRYGGLSANDCIDMLNQALFRTLKEKLITSPKRTRSFFDLVPISHPRNYWSNDGVHMDGEDYKWYSVIINYWLQTLCNGL